MLFVFVFPMLKSTSIIFPSYHHHMKATSATQHFVVIFFLKEGYSLWKFESKTGLGRSTIGRIKKGLINVWQDMFDHFWVGKCKLRSSK